MIYTTEELNKNGVYCILNLINGKQYIGSTSQSFRMRWAKHKSYLRRNIHHSKHLQRSWNKHTEQAFEFIIIEYCEPDQCITREQHYIDTLDVCNDEFGYNMCPTAGSPLGKKRSEETKIKMSLAQIGRKHSEETRAKLSLVNKGRKHSQERITNAVLKGNKNKTYIVTDPNNIEITTNKLREFCIINGLNYNCMRQIATGRVKLHKGIWKCRFAS